MTEGQSSHQDHIQIARRELMDSKVWSFSAVGQDRPGIVAALSRLLFDHNCNLSDSSMTILAGQFAIVTILETGEQTDSDKLLKAISDLGEKWHLQINAGPIEDEQTTRDQECGDEFLVSVYGADQAGITWKISELIASEGYNVTDLSTKKIEGSAPVYILLLEVEARPGAKNSADLDSALQALGDELSCSVSLKPIESTAL